MAKGSTDMSESGKAAIKSRIKDGVGKGPKMGVSDTDPTSQQPKKVGGIDEFMSDSELKPNSVSGTRSF